VSDRRVAGRRAPSLFAIIGGGAALIIVIASILVRFVSPGDPAADVARQREAVDHFHELVRDERWREVYRLTSEPPSESPQDFEQLMATQIRKQGKVVRVSTKSLRLLRSRAVPLLEVRETVTLSKDGRRSARDVVSFFAQVDDRWLFAFSVSD
jgi:hypothetical protein